MTSLPLKSKRLTAVQLLRLAHGMDIPTSASTEDVTLMINGRPTEMGKAPQNVQVVVTNPEEGMAG